MIGFLLFYTMVLFSFNDDQSHMYWRTVNDAVMGGISNSNITHEDGVMTFSGNVSLENNGGFASCRTRPFSLDLSEYSHLSLRVRGDGQKYSFRIWTNTRWDGASYVQSFETTEGEWQEISLPLNEFYPQFRGYRLRDYPALNPSKINQFGILISDKQEGQFNIEVDWIKAANQPN